MIFLVTALLALVLVFAPLYAALPDDPTQIASSLWTSALCAGVFLAALLAVVTARRGNSLSEAFQPPPSRPEAAFLILLGLAFLSLLARLVTQHDTAFFGPMLRGWTTLAADFALFALARRVAVSKACLYGLALAAVVGSAIVADLGVQEHVAFLRAGSPEARTFGTSTPDYLAGYFVLLLPVTLALFLEVPGRRGLSVLLRGLSSLVLAIVLLFQLVTLLTTGSRFGLISLVVALIVFALALLRAVRRGLILDKAARLILGGIGIVLVLGGLAFVRPVLARLQNLNDNSAAFRVWTWRGSLDMAAANPLTGTGIGTWTDLYPGYALTGFTRVAHNSYLQMADECGVLGLLALLVTLGLLGVSLARGLSSASKVTDDDGLLPQDSRLLLCGVLAALAGGVVRNLIDSDWYIFFLGTTFWILAGLGAGAGDLPLLQRGAGAGRASPAPTGFVFLPSGGGAGRGLLVALGSVAAALAALLGAQAVGASYALQAAAQLAADPGGAAQSYDTARTWDPLNGRYPSDQGYKAYYARGGDVLQAERALEAAVALAPNSVNYRRLGTVLQASGRTDEALASYQKGLLAEPNSLELLVLLAKLSPPPQAIEYYRKLSELELSPVGTARALGESVEPRFAVGTAALGDASAQSDPARAAAYYNRAAHLLERYIADGGSMNAQRQLLTGGHPDPQADGELRALYGHTLSAWIALAPPPQKASLGRRQAEYTEKFDKVLEQASKPGIL